VLAEQIVCDQLSAIVAELGSVNITAGDGLTLQAESGDVNSADINFIGNSRTYKFRPSYDEDSLCITTDNDGDGIIYVGVDLDALTKLRPSYFGIEATQDIHFKMYEDANNFTQIDMDHDATAKELTLALKSGVASSTELYLLANDAGDNYLRFTGDIIFPAANDTTSLGIETTNLWSNVWASLINGSDYSFLNKWRLLESDKYEGYPEGIAVGVEGFNNGVVTEKMPTGLKPLFAITKEFIEFNGVRITTEQFKRLI